MNTIRVRPHHEPQDVEAFQTVDAAKQSIPVACKEWTRQGYAVLFKYEDQYGVYVHAEDRYYSDYLPLGSQALFGGWWKKGEIVTEWEQIGNISRDERDFFGDALADFFEDEKANND